MSELRPGNDSMTSPVSWREPNSGVILSTPGSPARSSETTLNDKCSGSNLNTPNTKFSPTSAVGLTSNDVGCEPYWNSVAKEWSERLWLPTATDFAASGSSLSSGWWSETVAGSWFSTKLLPRPQPSLLKTSSPYSMSSPAACMDSALTVRKSYKIRLSPSVEQRRLLKSWRAATRLIYNRTIEYLRKPGTTANWKAIKTVIIAAAPEWTKDVPYQIRSVAIRDACQAVSHAKIMYKRTGQFNQVRFRSIRDGRDSLFIPRSAVKSKGCYITLLGEDLQPREEVPPALHDCRLLHQRGKWFLCVPVDVTVKSHPSQAAVVALDPGVRTFQSFYSPEVCGKVGEGDFGRSHRLCSYMDKLLSRMPGVTHARRRRIKRAVARMRERIQNLVSELHWKTALWLCRNFSTILLPTFEVRKMVCKLRSKTARAMLTWAHFRFKERLKHKAVEWRRQVKDVSEAYTSRTCSACGKLHPKNSKKLLACTCGVTQDRDLNGARGTFLKNAPALPDSAWPALVRGLAFLPVGL